MEFLTILKKKKKKKKRTNSQTFQKLRSKCKKAFRE